MGTNSRATTRPPEPARAPRASGLHARRRTRPATVHLLAALLLLLGANALVGGALLIADPSGGLLGMPVALLTGSPFHDYLLPGLVLFGLLGLVPLAVATVAWLRPRWTYLPRAGVDGAWLGSLGVGVFLIIWIGVQMTILRFFLQPVLLGLGTALVAVSLLPPVRHYFDDARASERRPSHDGGTR